MPFPPTDKARQIMALQVKRIRQLRGLIKLIRRKQNKLKLNVAMCDQRRRYFYCAKREGAGWGVVGDTSYVSLQIKDTIIRRLLQFS